MILFGHPYGAPFARHAVLGLLECGLEPEVVTAFAYHGVFAEVSRFLSLERLLPQLQRRAWLPAGNFVVHQYPVRESARQLIERSGLRGTLGISPQRLADWVARGIDLHLARLLTTKHRAVYCYEDSAAECFARAKDLGIRRIYDLPIMFHKDRGRIEQEEAERFPELRPVLFAANEPVEKLARKDREVELADTIIVASSLTKRSLVANGIADSKIAVIPYGIDSLPRTEVTREERPFTVLFVGRVGPRKGVHYLLQAWSELAPKKAELHLVGVNEMPTGWLERNLGDAVYHPSISQSELERYYRRADLLVLPSLVEGFGMVVLEAMSFGVPVLATSNTALPDLTTDGEAGFIVPPGGLQALKERLGYCLEERAVVAGMREAARQVAEKNSWVSYRKGVGEIVRRVIS